MRRGPAVSMASLPRSRMDRARCLQVARRAVGAERQQPASSSTESSPIAHRTKEARRVERHGGRLQCGRRRQPQHARSSPRHRYRAFEQPHRGADAVPDTVERSTDDPVGPVALAQRVHRYLGLVADVDDPEPRHRLQFEPERVIQRGCPPPACVPLRSRNPLSRTTVSPPGPAWPAAPPRAPPEELRPRPPPAPPSATTAGAATIDVRSRSSASRNSPAVA